VLNVKVKDVGEYIFIIYYKKDMNKYYIRTYREKGHKGVRLLLLRLDLPYILRKTEIFFIGDLYFQVTLKNENAIEIEKLPSKRSPERK
jgi:hypothetical protein